MGIPNIPFESFQKIPRLNRAVVVTEKIDGTNAVIYIPDNGIEVFAGSRTRWITPENDNYSFAKWVEANKTELLKLGPGLHYGEWWGSGIQRGYGLKNGEKRFSLFNTARWAENPNRPACCLTVPLLYCGSFEDFLIGNNMAAILNDLKTNGSKAQPGFMNPEGIVVYHAASRMLFKKTLDKDDQPKGAKEE